MRRGEVACSLLVHANPLIHEITLHNRVNTRGHAGQPRLFVRSHGAAASVGVCWIGLHAPVVFRDSSRARVIPARFQGLVVAPAMLNLVFGRDDRLVRGEFVHRNEVRTGFVVRIGLCVRP